MSKELCIVVAIILFIAALLVGKNASRMFGYYVAKILGIATAVFVVLAIVTPAGSGGVVDMEYCVLSALIWALICLAIFFRLLKYIFMIAIVGGGIWLLAWLFRNALADGGLIGTSIVIGIICFVSLFIIGLIRKAVK